MTPRNTMLTTQQTIETGMKIKVTFVIVLSLESNRHDYTSPDLEYRTVLPGRNKHNTA